jgi:hypothetical protein
MCNRPPLQNRLWTDFGLPYLLVTDKEGQNQPIAFSASGPLECIQLDYYNFIHYHHLIYLSNGPIMTHKNVEVM